MQEQDIQLAARCARLAEQSRPCRHLAGDNRETVGSECTTLQKEMRRAARFFGKCEQAADARCVWASSAPASPANPTSSRALARRTAAGDLLADFCGRTSDFITEIKPEGGKESTGWVTRFTTTPPQGLTAGLPQSGCACSRDGRGPQCWPIPIMPTANTSRCPMPTPCGPASSD